MFNEDLAGIERFSPMFQVVVHLSYENKTGADLQLEAQPANGGRTDVDDELDSDSDDDLASDQEDDNVNREDDSTGRLENDSNGDQEHGSVIAGYLFSSSDVMDCGQRGFYATPSAQPSLRRVR